LVVGGSDHALADDKSNVQRMSRLTGLLAIAFFAGLVLVLSEVTWFSRRSLIERIRPYAPLAVGNTSRTGILSVASFREVIAPLSRAIGERMARMFGVNEELGLRLERIHATTDVTEHRVRQVAWMAVTFIGAVAMTAALQLPTTVGALLIIGSPTLAFLTIEQRVAAASTRWQRELFEQLPILAEQLGLLLGAGFSLGSALNRLAKRGTGACGMDLRRVVSRVRQGLSEGDALREWALIADVAAVHHLVSVLSLNREGGDLGRLIADEARSIRRDAHRELIERIERRGEQVWIPVTVATLVPGVIFMAVPFVQALSLFSSS
jgi:Flp pilus assembly protein TadB